jgi:primosomal protein N' (replication factor Y)
MEKMKLESTESIVPAATNLLASEHLPPRSYPQWVEVLVDCPATQGVFIYSLPSDSVVQPGDILSVPFAAQQVGAIALSLLDQLPPDLSPTQVRPVTEVVTHSFFPPHYWTLLNQVAQYYCTPLMSVLRVALPPGLLGRSQRRLRLVIPASSNLDLSGLSLTARHILQLLKAQKTGDYSWRYLQRQVKGAQRGIRELRQRGWVEHYLEPPAAIRPKRRQAVTLTATPMLDSLDLTGRQREVLETLKRQGGEVWMTELLQLCQTSSSTLKALAEKGWVMIHFRELLRTEQAPIAPRDRPQVLTPDQSQALAAITALSGCTQVLLHGVTGSGKTEVYLQAIAPILQRGDSALVLVPEIGLTPQLTDRFRARFGNQVCVYHSALADGERYDTWRQMLSGSPQVVIGTRSAVFAPLPKLGLIVLDEEHDTSFKQDHPAPCYHARTVAHWRSHLSNCPLLLGSATPSLESWLEVVGDNRLEDTESRQRDTGTQRHRDTETDIGTRSPSPRSSPSPPSPFTASSSPSSLYLSLPERIYARPLPPVTIVDMRQELQAGNHSIFSRTLQTALQTLQAKQQQGILFIQRRGHSTFVSCRSCGYVLDCPNCDVALAYHLTHEQARPLLRCHYCNFTRVHPPHCPECQSPYLKYFGSGTQRVTQELSRMFPQLRCLRFDSDTTRTKGAHRAILTRFAQGEADILVGTQMLTKGIDLPQVTLVGVIAADGLLFLSDYRASERAAQTLTQVAGRSGRGDDPGQVIVQTYAAQNAVVQAVRQHDYLTFIQNELRHRQRLNYPPYGRLILLRLSSPDPEVVEATAQELAMVLHTLQADDHRFEILGPAPAQVMRVARRYRWQILLKFPKAMALSDLPDLSQVRSLCPAQVHLTIDVDPLNPL